MSIVKRVAAIHDLCGYGKASLNVVIPVMAAMGIQVNPMPTAVLSTHTGFEGFTFHDLTTEMIGTINHWKNLEIEFEAIYSGFLASPYQAEIVSSFISDFKSKDQLVLVDPVMADNGKFYSTMDQTMVTAMKDLIYKANIITPNLTELSFLVNKPYEERLGLSKIMAWMKMLAEAGPNYVVVTSVPIHETGQSSVIGYDQATNRFWRVMNKHLPVYYPGTGDTFASVLLGCMMKGENFPASIDRAVQFISQAIHWSYGYDQDRQQGPLIEGVLHTLSYPFHSYTYELLE